jgi:TATA-binding protein-associated factor
MDCREMTKPKAEKRRLSRRGAGLAFVQLSTQFGENLLEVIPKMWQSMAGGVLTACSTGAHIAHF